MSKRILAAIDGLALQGISISTRTTDKEVIYSFGDKRYSVEIVIAAKWLGLDFKLLNQGLWYGVDTDLYDITQSKYHQLARRVESDIVDFLNKLKSSKILVGYDENQALILIIPTQEGTIIADSVGRSIYRKPLAMFLEAHADDYDFKPLRITLEAGQTLESTKTHMTLSDKNHMANLERLKEITQEYGATFDTQDFTNDKKIVNVHITKEDYSLYVLFILEADEYTSYDISSKGLIRELYPDTLSNSFTYNQRNEEILNTVELILSRQLTFTKKPGIFNKNKGCISVMVDGKTTTINQRVNAFHLPETS